jgi:hypothetical protein
MRRGASWVSAYALTNDYAAEAARFVRRDSRLVQKVSERSSFGRRRGLVLVGTAVEVSPGTMERTLFGQITATKDDEWITTSSSSSGHHP